MEKIAYLFNGDFEKDLFSNTSLKLQSTKRTQEFEYFIHLLEPSYTIYSSKNYSLQYLNFIQQFSGAEFKVTHQVSKIIPWSQNMSHEIDLKNFQDKSKFLDFLISNKLIEENIEFIKSFSEVENGFLYKYPKSFSGEGHLLSPRDNQKIKKILAQDEVLIKEKNHNRTLDFSTLVDKGKVLCRYENYIDDHFQYKGTYLKAGFDLPSKFKQQYQKTLEVILEHTKSYQGVMSVDSYLYDDGDGEKLFAACELNMRKTMGYVAFKLKQKYFSSMKHFKMLLVNSKNKTQDVNYNDLAENTFLLSPLENRFYVFALAAQDELKLKEREQKLFSTFF